MLIFEEVFHVFNHFLTILPKTRFSHPKLRTCGISTIPLEIALFLTSACLVVVWG